jgi:hypothetical protein
MIAIKTNENVIIIEEASFGEKSIEVKIETKSK